MTHPDNKKTRTVQSVKTTFRIIEYLKTKKGARVTEISDELGLAKSTVHRHLTSLYEEGYLGKEGDEYFLGFKFLELGESTKQRKQYFSLAEEMVEMLANSTDERAQFMIEEHGWSVFLYRSAGQNAVKTDPGIGNRAPIHASAAGKAILAMLPHEQVRDIIDLRGLPQLTEHTIETEEELFEDLEQIRDRGYSINDQENIEGLRAMGVPVLGPNDFVIGGLSLSGPTHRFKGEWFENELPDLLRGCANELTLNIKYQ